MKEKNKKIYEIKCPDCNYTNNITSEWKVFNVITCPRCFRNINLPWCRKGFEAKPRESMLIIELDEKKDASL